MSTICKKCGTQYDSQFCPNCGTPAQEQVQMNQSQQTPPPIMPQQPFNPNQFNPNQTPKKKKHGCLFYGLIVLGFLIFISVLIAIFSNNDDPNLVDNNNTSDASDDKATPVPEKTTFSIGETVEYKDILVTLIGVTESGGSDFNRPSDGNVFALCEFEIANNSDDDIAVSSIISFEAYCDDYAINQSLGGLLEKGDKGQLDGSVAAGKKMNGVIAYEIPEDWKELEISFKPSFWSNKDITFIATK